MHEQGTSVFLIDNDVYKYVVAYNILYYIERCTIRDLVRGGATGALPQVFLGMKLCIFKLEDSWKV